MNSNLIQQEIERVVAETGDCPRVVFVSVSSYAELMRQIHFSNGDSFSQYGFQKVEWCSPYGGVLVKPSKTVPDGVVLANSEDYAGYWARYILMEDNDESPCNR